MLEFLTRRHDRFAQRPLTDEERAIVDANVPYATRLPDEERRELDGLIRIFLDQKRFEGCNGLELTEEIRVTIAAQACVLMLRREGDPYPELELVLVYPQAFRSKIIRQDGYVVTEGEEARLGESSDRGVVVIAWDHVNRATQRHEPGHNVVFHELAHQLDAEDGAMDGAPDLPSRSRYRQWAEVFGAEYAKLGRSLRQGTSSDIDDYGATSPAEFFAVVTEMFFERPRSLRARHPALYAELAAFYGQDPAELGKV